MIDITKQICDLADSVPSLNGKVYRTWPQKRVKSLFAVVNPLSHSAELTAADGSEIIARLTYAITLATPTQSDLDSVSATLIDLYQSYNLRALTAGPYWSAEQSAYMQVITISASVDKRGNATI